MYFFDRDGLVDTLASRPLASREAFNYLLGFFAYGMISQGFVEIMEQLLQLPGQSRTANFPLVALVTWTVMGGFLFGIARMLLNWLYNANGGDQDDQFLGNLLAVTWVINMRYALLYAIMFLAMAIAVSPLVGLDPNIVFPVAVLGFLGLLVVFVAILYSIRNALADIRAKKISRTTV